MRDASQTARLDQDRAAISETLDSITATARRALVGCDPNDVLIAIASELVDVVPQGQLALFVATWAVREAEKRA